jgi:hypothetical protein
MGTAGPKVGFMCVATAHLEKNGAPVDHLTIVDRDWAFCASDVRADGHDWKPTGGVSLGELELLVRRMRERTGQGVGPDGARR